MNGDTQLRNILPLLRPRSAEPTLFSQTVWYLLWIGIAALLALYIRRWVRHRRRRLAEFQEAASAAGLTGPQAAFLYRIARKQRMQSPPRLLSSPQVFDRQIGAWADQLAERNLQHADLAIISQIRTALAFEDLDVEQSLSSTRQIDRGQTLMLGVDRGHVEDEELFPWLVLERDEGSLTLAQVLREDRTEMELRPGERVSGRFWREGDTEYSFSTTVIRRSRADRSLDVRHARVEREQNRDFYRIDVDFPADFLLVRLDDAAMAGVDGVHSDAAINLLDQSQTNTIRVDSTVAASDSDPDAGTDASATAQNAERLAAAPRVSARVVNLSAGGLAIQLPPGQTDANEDMAWMVDPTFEGPFPLAGLTCVPLSSAPDSGGGRRIKMRFEELPIVAEKAIVRGVYEHQLHAAGGRGQPPAGAAPIEDDDLPTS